MSITTKKGDQGETDLLFGTRVGKEDARIVAVGDVDELTSALGLVRVAACRPATDALLKSIQLELISLMGLCAVESKNLERYQKQNFGSIETSQVERLTTVAAEIEATVPPFTDWVLPGGRNVASAAHLDFARTVCRRAERSLIAVWKHETPHLETSIAYLNRLSDLLWLLARQEEAAV
jgi:cob(I)alamin adenosyltransferase